MTSLFMAAIIAPLALQAAPATTPQAITSLDDLPIEESTAPRCGVAFAVVSRWQKDNDPRGANYPDMESSGGREFFVRSVANLMEGRGLTRENVSEMIVREVTNLDSSEGAARIEAMMPTCLLMKQSAGL